MEKMQQKNLVRGLQLWETTLTSLRSSDIILLELRSQKKKVTWAKLSLNVSLQLKLFPCSL